MKKGINLEKTRKVIGGSRELPMIKTKTIKRGLKNPAKSFNNVIVKKIGEDVEEFFNSTLRSEKNVSALTKAELMDFIMSIKPDFIDIEINNLKDSLSEHDLDILERGIKSVSKGHGGDISYISFVLKEGDEEIDVISPIGEYYSPDLKDEGRYGFMGMNYKAEFISLKHLLGELYLRSVLESKMNDKEELERFLLYYFNRSNIILYYDDLLKDFSEGFKEKYKDIFPELNRRFIYREYNENKAQHINSLYNNYYLYFQVSNYRYFGGKIALLPLRITSLFSYVYDFYALENMKEDEREKMFKRLEGDYARSFETKKNINKNIKEKMSSSKFLSHFNFVEYDNSASLEKINEIEEEWLELIKILNLKKTNNELRFRKLGQHRAKGLYYPYAKCVCVDLRSTDSFVHEVFHMIDYEYGKKMNYQGKISYSLDFIQISELYKKLVEEELEKKPEIKNQLKGKFDLSYFFQSEEIFARCGEIYLENILKDVKGNHLLGVKEGVFYPKDEALIKKIKNFYDDLDLINYEALKE